MCQAEIEESQSSQAHSKGIGSGIATTLTAAGARLAMNYSSERKGAERVAQAIIDELLNLLF